jgi:hypothetical protein
VVIAAPEHERGIAVDEQFVAAVAGRRSPGAASGRSVRIGAFDSRRGQK